MTTNQERRGQGQVWAIVLAGGEGSRLAPLTRGLYGFDLPKQFAAFDGGRSFLRETMDRIAQILAPAATVVVASDLYLDLARGQLAAFPGVEIVSQPGNIGTTGGLLLCLAHILARDPDARVVVFPSDHLVERPARFADAVRRALLAIDAAPTGVALVGAVADRPASDLGWIVPGAALGHPMARAHAVTRFVEKPVAPLALDLLRAGALWNTLVIAAHGSALAALCARARPDMASAFDGYRSALSAGTGASTILDALYSRLRPSDLSRDVLQRSDGLAVVTMTDAGWSDCGTPQGLIESLRRSGRLSSARALLLDFLAEPPANTSQTHHSGPQLLRGPSATDTF